MNKIVLPNRQPEGIGAWLLNNGFGNLMEHQHIEASQEYLAENYQGWPFAENIFRVWFITNSEIRAGPFRAVCQDKHGLSSLTGKVTRDRLTFTKTYEDEAVARDGSLTPKEYVGVLGREYSWSMIGAFRDVAGLITTQSDLRVLPFIMLLQPYYKVKGNPRARYW